MIRKWCGTPLITLFYRIDMDTTARYVGFECADSYYEDIDMLRVLHPPTLMAFKSADGILPTRYDYPFKPRISTKRGCKNPKFITTLYATNQPPRGFRTDRGYNWFSGI